MLAPDSVESDREPSDEIVFDFAVLAVATNAARYLPLHKIGRCRVRIPRLRKDVVEVAFLHVF